jgi:synaptic vesicle membrane protein VAT-1
MKKVVVHRAGGWERLQIETGPEPTIGVGDARVHVEHSGINYADVLVRMGLYKSAVKYVGWPIVPGFEFSGTVDAVGKDSTHRVGDRVFGVTRFGGYASSIVVPDRQLYAVPESMTLAQAAAFPAVGLTAWYALKELVRIRPGARVLIHSAAGGVGSAALQVAALQGATVVGVVGGAHKVATATKLGAKFVIDKSKGDLWKQAEQFSPEGYDVVLDPNGAETLQQSYRHLAETGKLLVYGFQTMLSRGKDKPSLPKLAIDFLRTPRFSPLDMCDNNKSVIAFNISYLFGRADILQEAMSELLGWLAEGKLQAPQVTSFAFDQVAEAHKAIESGSTVGKLVLSHG